MRTNIMIDDELLAQAMRLTGLRTQQKVVKAALKALIVNKKQDKLADAFGTLHWEDDLDAMRNDRCAL
jgi:Arc/MetJ family transcription regulator